MKRHTHRAFRLLQVAYPGWTAKYDAEMVEEWGRLLEDVDGDALVAAVERLAKSSKFPPAVAEIRESAGHAVSGGRLTGIAKMHADALAGHRGERDQRLARENSDPMHWFYAMNGHTSVQA